MTDFPRGWTLPVLSALAGAATITLPATPGVVHVLDAFSASIVNISGAAPVEVQLTLSSSDGTYTGVVLAELYAAVGTRDPDSDSGLNIAAGPGASLTLNMAAGAGCRMYIRALGHDI